MIQAAKTVMSSREALVNVLESIGQFVGRLKIYTEISLSSTMVEIVIQIMVELISILALETKKFTRRRLSESVLTDVISLTQCDTAKSIKIPWGDKEVDKDIVAVLLKMDRLTQYELQNAAAQTLGVVSVDQMLATFYLPYADYPSL